MTLHEVIDSLLEENIKRKSSQEGHFRELGERLKKYFDDKSVTEVNFFTELGKEAYVNFDPSNSDFLNMRYATIRVDDYAFDTKLELLLGHFIDE